MGCGCNKGKNQKKWQVTTAAGVTTVFNTLAEANHAKRKAGTGATLREVK